MRVAATVTLASICTSAYALVTPRDAKAITGVISAVQTDVDGLDSALKGWNTDPEPVLDASNKLLATIKDGSVTVQGSSNLSFSDAVTLLGPVQQLEAHGQSLLTDFKGKKDLIQKNGFCEIARTQITKVKDEGQGLIDATISKLPKSVQEIAKDVAQGLVDQLNDAETAFSSANCVNA